MSYRNSENEKMSRVRNAISELVDSFKDTNDPMFYDINPTCFDLLFERFQDLGYEVSIYKKIKVK